MKLIVGLGNPDDKYKNTFHNLGFMTVDALANKLNVSFNKNKCRALIAEYKTGAQKVIIAKPLTYMNLSGESVRELLSFYKISVSDCLVIYDDYDLEKGFIRIRESGSAGTHNGMRNIIKEIAQTNFPRVRIGFKQSEDGKIPLLNYVLSGIKPEEKSIFDKAISVAAEAAYEFAEGKKIQDIMQAHNGKAQ